MCYPLNDGPYPPNSHLGSHHENLLLTLQMAAGELRPMNALDDDMGIFEQPRAVAVAISIRDRCCRA